MPDPSTKPVLRPSDLQWLACPVCRQPLALEADVVYCTGCGRRYPTVDGIPVLLADRAS
jgi:uncharacterized protein YbaR (Trm112 family)